VELANEDLRLLDEPREPSHSGMRCDARRRQLDCAREKRLEVAKDLRRVVELFELATSVVLRAKHELTRRVTRETA
jgi:hypothetical protein